MLARSTWENLFARVKVFGDAGSLKTNTDRRAFAEFSDVLDHPIYFHGDKARMIELLDIPAFSNPTTANTGWMRSASV